MATAVSARKRAEVNFMAECASKKLEEWVPTEGCVCKAAVFMYTDITVSKAVKLSALE